MNTYLCSLAHALCVVDQIFGFGLRLFGSLDSSLCLRFRGVARCSQRLLRLLKRSVSLLLDGSSFLGFGIRCLHGLQLLFLRELRPFCCPLGTLCVLSRQLFGRRLLLGSSCCCCLRLFPLLFQLLFFR